MPGASTQMHHSTPPSGSRSSSRSHPDSHHSSRDVEKAFHTHPTLRSPLAGGAPHRATQPSSPPASVWAPRSTPTTTPTTTTRSGAQRARGSPNPPFPAPLHRRMHLPAKALMDLLSTSTPGGGGSSKARLLTVPPAHGRRGKGSGNEVRLVPRRQPGSGVGAWGTLSPSRRPVAGVSSSWVPTATFADLPQELLETIFECIDCAWTLGAAAQVCTRWTEVLQLVPRLWQSIVLPIRNPVFTPSLGGWVSGPIRRAVGAEVLPPAHRELVSSAGISRARMIGPNIHRDTHHISQLAVEIPSLQELFLQRCVLTEPSIRQIAIEMKSLRRVVIEYGWTPVQLNLLQHLPPSVATLTIIGCPLRDRTLGLLLRLLPWLTHLNLVQCDRVTRHGLGELVHRHTGTTISHPFLQSTSAPTMGGQTRRYRPLRGEVLSGDPEPWPSHSTASNHLSTWPDPSGHVVPWEALNADEVAVET